MKFIILKEGVNLLENIMIRWKINKIKSEITIHYNFSQILSYRASGGPNSPIIEWLTNNIDFEIFISKLSNYYFKNCDIDKIVKLQMLYTIDFK